jgi:hypothetical protein
LTTTNVEYKIRVNVCSTVCRNVDLGQTAFAHEGKKYDKDQTIDQENHCKIVISNEHGDNNRQNNNDNELTCQNLAQNAREDASVDGNPFTH